MSQSLQVLRAGAASLIQKTAVVNNVKQGGILSGGISGGVVGAGLGLGASTLAQLYSHYKPGLQAASDLHNSNVPQSVKSRLFDVGTKLYPKFNMDWGRGISGATIGGVGGAGLGMLDAADTAMAEEAREAAKKKELNDMINIALSRLNNDRSLGRA
jgi:hypothetical protein